MKIIAINGSPRKGWNSARPLRIFLLGIAMITSIFANAQQAHPVEIEGSVGKLAAHVQLPETAKSGKCHVVIVCHGRTLASSPKR